MVKLNVMSRYLVGKLGHAALILWGAFTLTFILLQVMPGDAVLVKFQDPDLGLTPRQISEMRLTYGADDSHLVQYGHTLIKILHGNFGYSVQQGVPVSSLIRTALPVTLRLALCGFFAAILEALVTAIAAYVLPAQFLRNLVRALPGFWGAVPVFWLGIAIIQVISFKLRIIPIIGVGPWEGMILPTLTVSLPVAAPLTQIIIKNMDEVSHLGFVMVARTKGGGALWVLWHHILPNALLPFLTMAGLVFGELLAGAVVTETIFGLNGIGQLTQQAVAGQDVSVLQAVVIISAGAYVTLNLGVDLLYPLIDPRFRRERSSF